jgi:hypothetical protein
MLSYKYIISLFILHNFSVCKIVYFVITRVLANTYTFSLLDKPPNFYIKTSKNIRHSCALAPQKYSRCRHSRIAPARPSARTNQRHSTRCVALFPSDKNATILIHCFDNGHGLFSCKYTQKYLDSARNFFSSVPLPITQIINPPVEYSPHCDHPHSDKRHRSFIISCLFSGVEFTAAAV